MQVTQNYSGSINENSLSVGGQDSFQTAREIISRGLKRVYTQVDYRHDQIQELYSQGMLLKQIALKLGMANHTSVLYHINGKCRCNKRDSYRFRQEIINKAKMWDVLKAAMEEHPIYEVMELMEMEIGNG